MSNTPLYDAIAAYIRRRPSRFHTPGHGGDGRLFPFADIAPFDLTEAEGLDALYEASGPILEAEKLAAGFFGAKRTLISAGGCTLCIQAMLRLCAPGGGKVVMGRGAHRAAVNAAALLGIEPVWVWPKEGRITPESVQKVLEANGDVRAVYLTSPDYFGRISDISGLAGVCRQRGVPLLVDNAHGAHLGLTQGSFHPIQQGASMTACSAHKTLPVLTGGAWLNIGDERFAAQAKDAMALFGSTSPSYPIMASLDLARAFCEEQGKAAFGQLKERVDDIKRLAGELGFGLPVGACDPVRITLATAQVGMTGPEVAARFRAAGVEPEYVEAYHVVLLPNVFHTQKDFIRLSEALKGLPRSTPLGEKPFILPPDPPKAMPLSKALLASERVKVPITQAQGRVCAGVVCPCPPGIPVVMPGELVTNQAVQFLSQLGVDEIDVVNPTEKKECYCC